MRLNHLRFGPVLLLALGAAACTGEGTMPGSGTVASNALHTAFPQRADEVLHGSRAWLATTDGFSVEPNKSAWRSQNLTTLVARHTRDGIQMQAGNALELRVKELGAHGPVSMVEGALSHARTDGTSYWVGMPSGVEEWLLIERDVTDAAEPVASWEVDGGWLRKDGAQVLISAEKGGPAQVAVSAPFAYSPKGAIAVSLSVEGHRIHVHVEPSAGPLLIDPMWINFAGMQAIHYEHAAGLLGNGNVIVTGGQGDDGTTGASEVYNAATATWQSVGFSVFRDRFTGTSLTNGNVLFVGGSNGFSELPTTTIYSAVGGFTNAPNLFDPRFNHTATRLNDGRVMVCGGEQNGQQPASGQSGGFGTLDSCEIFDPMTTSWSNAGFMNSTRQLHAAGTLQDGRVIQCGGCDQFGGFLNDCEIFDPAAPALGWLDTPSFSGARARHTVTVLNDGRVLITGGDDFGLPLNSVRIYNPVTQSWTNGGSLTTPRTDHTATLMLDGNVLLVGGSNGQATINSAEIFNTTTNTSSLTLPITGAREAHVATSLTNGNVLVTGGIDYNTFTAAQSSMEYENQLPNGAPCSVTTANQCLSGICEDNVCCDVTCTGDCMACSAGAKGGGVDGVCEPVTSGFSCGEESCTADGEDIDAADTCDGAGTCVDAGIVECGFYLCVQGDGLGCSNFCQGDDDCGVDGFCDGANNCLGKKVVGTPAVNPNECTSGFVADGVCCDSACDLGQCDACTAALGADSDGVCTAVIGNCDDGNPCTVDSCLANGCGTESVLDQTTCPGGICIAGQCIPHASNAASSTNGAGGASANGAGGATATGVGGAGGDSAHDFDAGDAALEGTGICTTSAAGRQGGDAAWMILGLGLALGALGRRRRREDELVD